MANESLILSGIGSGLKGARCVGSMLGYKPTPQETNPNAVLPIEIPFTRGSVGMEYVNGLWQEAAINKPRRYNDAYLNEPLSQNQLTHNTTFTGWTQVLQSFSAGVQSPIKDVLSKRMLVTGVGSNYLLQSLNATVGTRTVTASLFVKNVDYVGNELLNLNVSDGVVGGMTAYYKPSDDTITFNHALSWTNVSVKKTAEGQGFTRIAITGTVTSAATGWFEITGTNGRSIDIIAPQFELGSVATSPIITAGAAVTRLADYFVLNQGGSSAGGTWFIHLKNNTVALSSSASSAPYVGSNFASGVAGWSFVLRQGGAAQRPAIWKYENGVGTALYTTLTDEVKIAVTWNGVTADVWVNEVKVVAGTAFATSVLQYLASGNSGTIGRPFFIVEQRIYPSQITDLEAESLTTI
jgi:hypothetical protein